jgi:predicted nucleic acid-binding protein
MLDAGPIGLACCQPSQPKTIRCESWLSGLQTSGVVILIPAIADYEVRRELIRTRATAKLERLAKLRRRFNWVDITSEALEQAAHFWAILRQTGRPTAGNDALDADAILAGMASTVAQPGDSVMIATTNVNHLARFPGIDARLWETIV